MAVTSFAEGLYNNSENIQWCPWSHTLIIIITMITMIPKITVIAIITVIKNSHVIHDCNYDHHDTYDQRNLITITALQWPQLYHSLCIIRKLDSAWFDVFSSSNYCLGIAIAFFQPVHNPALQIVATWVITWFFITSMFTRKIWFGTAAAWCRGDVIEWAYRKLDWTVVREAGEKPPE